MPRHVVTKLKLLTVLSRITAHLGQFHLVGLGGLRRWQFPYQRWVRRFDTLNDERRASIRRQVESLPSKPMISVVMPVYNTPERWLRLAIESVRRQLYPHWELCIADDASIAPHVRPILEEYCRLDGRIKVVFRRENGHISAASNSALALAKGEFIALLDHDDELAEHALFLVAREMNRQPDADIIYSDEDRLDEQGRRFDPHFKPDWNPDLFHAQNYLCHLTVYRATLVQSVGGFREGYEGSQDYDLALRCTVRSRPERIRHLPYILYHWRAIAGSTAQELDHKGYAATAGLSALGDLFAAIDPRIVVTAGLGATTYRVRYPLPEPPPLVSLIIPTRDNGSVLRRCLESIFARTDYPRYELLIVDNGSRDGATCAYLAELAESGRARVLPYDREFNYSAINNLAVAEARGEVVGLLNDDLEVINGEWLSEMVRHAIRPEIGAVGAKLYYPDDRIQHAGLILGLLGTANPSHHFRSRRCSGYFGRLTVPQNVAAVTGACLVVRKSLYGEIGGMDAEHLAVAFNDVDFCLRLQEAGYRNLWTPFAELYHHESLSRGSDRSGAKQARLLRESGYMRQRWGRQLDADPCYNPNLSLMHRDFRPAWPPRVARAWE